MTLRKEIPEGGIYPGKWYGVAWDEFREDARGAVVVCYPIPLNVVARFVRWLRMYLQSGNPGRYFGMRRCSDCQKLMRESGDLAFPGKSTL